MVNDGDRLSGSTYGISNQPWVALIRLEYGDRRQLADPPISQLAQFEFRRPLLHPTLKISSLACRSEPFLDNGDERF